MTTTSRNTCHVLLATGLLASSAWAQSDNKPLNLNLPPNSATPTASASGAKPATASTAPGMYYGDTSGAIAAGGTTAINPNAAADACDDATYNKPEVHGSVGMGVVAGNRVSGNYQTGSVNVRKAFGSCNHPAGGLNITISDTQGHFDYPRRGR